MTDLSHRATRAEYQALADTLLAAVSSGDHDAAWRLKWAHLRFRDKSVHDVRAAEIGIADAREVIAREHGFENWAALVDFTEAVQRDPAVDRFEVAADAVVAGDIALLRSMLRQTPDLVHARSSRRHHATLLHYIGANGVEGGRQKTPPNAVEVANLLLEAGAEPDALADMYDAKCTTMSMLVSSCHPSRAGLQAALAETLLDHGAALEGPGTNWQSALMTALAFGYPDTAEALTARGALVNDVAAAAGLGRVADTARLLPAADSRSTQAALALAAQHGHADVVALLLDAGVDPNRYNPEGHHAHSTPLHQAVCAGHEAVVRLLVERGARLDIRDTIYDATPLGWAIYCQQPAIVAYLRDRGAPEA